MGGVTPPVRTQSRCCRPPPKPLFFGGGSPPPAGAGLAGKKFAPTLENSVHGTTPAKILSMARETSAHREKFFTRSLTAREKFFTRALVRAPRKIFLALMARENFFTRSRTGGPPRARGKDLPCARGGSPLIILKKPPKTYLRPALEYTLHTRRPAPLSIRPSYHLASRKSVSVRSNASEPSIVHQNFGSRRNCVSSESLGVATTFPASWLRK